MAKAVGVLGAALSIGEALRRDRAAWRAGPSGGTHVRITFTPEAWAVELKGVSVRFAMRFTDASWKIDCDETPATLLLRDALLAAGL